MIPSDQAPPSYDWLVRRIADLEREVQQLRAERRLESATIGRGGITVKDGGGVSVEGGDINVTSGGSVNVRDGGAVHVIDANGNDIGLIGDLSSAFGEGQIGVMLRRAGGYPAFAVYGTGEGGDTGFVGLYDLSGNYIVTDDAWSGRGLARPYIPLQVGEIAPPVVASDTSTFVDLLAGMSAIQHPVMYAYVLVESTDASTTGQVRIAVDGTGVGPTINVAGGEYAFRDIGPFALTVTEQTYGTLHRITVQARRTAGTGKIGVRVLSLLGLESAFV